MKCEIFARNRKIEPALPNLGLIFLRKSHIWSILVAKQKLSTVYPKKSEDLRAKKQGYPL